MLSYLMRHVAVDMAWQIETAKFGRCERWWPASGGVLLPWFGMVPHPGRTLNSVAAQAGVLHEHTGHRWRFVGWDSKVFGSSTAAPTALDFGTRWRHLRSDEQSGALSRR